MDLGVGDEERRAARQIVVSGGAGYWCGSHGLKLDEYVFSLTNQARPRVCVVCTASGDSRKYIEGFYDTFGERCFATHLSLFTPPFVDGEIRSVVAARPDAAAHRVMAQGDGPPTVTAIPTTQL